METNGKTHPNNGLTNDYGPRPSDIGVTDNPFISPRGARDSCEVGAAKEAHRGTVNEDDLPPVATEQRKNPRRKALIFCLTALTLVCVCLGLYMIYGGRKTIDYQIAEKRKVRLGQPGRQAQSETGMEEGATSQVTAEAINQAKEELRRQGAATGPGAAPSATPSTSTESGSRAASGATPVFTPYIVPDMPISPSAGARETTTGTHTGRGGERRGNAASGDEAAPDARNTRPSVRGGSSSSAHSIYVAAPESIGKTSAPNIPNPSRSPRMESRGLIDSVGVTVPSFGTMLPVRTMGAVYTLRQGSLARFELTRDMSGQGWALKLGTILVAQQQGSEHDRAFLSLVGFINPDTNRLVRLSGDLLGGDAAPGLKGKRRRVSSRWAGVFNRVANGAVALGQAALARGVSTTIITPGASGIGSEFGLSQSALTRREFVEVPAGAPAYVMVTDLPKETKAIDADPTTTNDGDSLTDEELADLLSNGSPEQIREALPRMHPEMRKIALVMLGGKVQ